MKYVCLWLITCFAVLSNAAAPGQLAAAPVQSWTDVDATTELLRQFNAYRQQAGLPPLVLSETACEAARMQAVYNLTHQTHGHYNPQYTTPRQRLIAVGHHFEKANGFSSYGYENCVRFRGMRAKNLTNIEAQILRAYEHSPKHNAALLDPHPTKVGIATVYNGDELQNSMIFCI